MAGKDRRSQGSERRRALAACHALLPTDRLTHSAPYVLDNCCFWPPHTGCRRHLFAAETQEQSGQKAAAGPSLTVRLLGV